MLDTLLLFKNRYSCTIPQSLGLSQGLKSLDLSDNQLTCSIPPVITMLMNNFLVNQIPYQIRGLPNLGNLLLWNNSLTDALPRRLGFSEKLVTCEGRCLLQSSRRSNPSKLLQRQQVRQSPTLLKQVHNPLPSTLANCTSFLCFRIQHSQINGSILTGFAFVPNLTYVDLNSNNFTSTITEDFDNVEKLEYFPRTHFTYSLL